MRFLTLFVVTICLMTFTLSFGETKRPLEKSEALITELKFYDALIALEPLLTDDKKSEEQEKAFWVANILCERLQEILSDEYLEYYQERKGKGFIKGDLSKEWGKVDILNRLGAGFEWSEPGGVFMYRYAFLKRLVKLYPNTSWRPPAEYYLILEGYDISQSPLSIDETLKALDAYVKKYEKSGLAEIYLAYLDLAHINHGRWAFLMHPNVEGPCGPVVSPIKVSEKDKEDAAVLKAEALKYYGKIIVGSPWFYQRETALRYYEELKQNKATGHDFLWYE